MPQPVFPPLLAALRTAEAGQQWVPSNGTEGDLFIAAWCGECQRLRNARAGIPGTLINLATDSCSVLAASTAGEASEWQIGSDGQPRCIAFVPAGEAVAAPRCPHTLELDL